MLVSLNWLSKYVDLPDDRDELLQRIGSRLAEVEGVTDLGEKYKDIVVAEIKQAKDHSDADKLGVYQVDIGGSETQVVAGDKTLNEGDKVAYIAPGLVVPATFEDDEPFTIEARDLRGEKSNGMLASTAELDWGTDHSGVLKLDTDKPAGTSLIEAYELDDQIVEIENKTLTHRPDCFGMIGFAREIAGIYGKKFEEPIQPVLKNLKTSESNYPLTIQLEAGEDCPRYVGLVFDNVSVKQSPLKTQSYLARVGVRPINNVVDITNYIAIVTGQPLHAFDYDKVKELSQNDAAIVVRYPKAGEKITLLDGREIEPRDKAVLICTDQKAVAVGGAMGGTETEVDENTKTILLESASFDLYSIRRTSMAHGIFSEAVTRFIRGQDPNQCLDVAILAGSMLGTLAGAKLASDPVDEYPNPVEKKTIGADVEFINNLLGTEFGADEMTKTLTNVSLEVGQEGEALSVTPPSFRRDLTIEEDIAEEIGRLHGYDTISDTLPSRDISATKLDARNQLILDIRDVMVGTGANEVLTYNFVSKKDFDKSGLDQSLAYELRNSISPKLQLLRTTILPSLIEKIHPNIKEGFSEFGLFEVNKSHRNNRVEDDLPVEELSVSYVFAADQKMRTEDDFGAAYYQARQITSYLLDELGIGFTEVKTLKDVDDDWVAVRAPLFDENRTSVIVSEKGVVGIQGEFKQSVAKAHKLPDYTAGFELNIDALLESADTSAQYVQQLKFPGTQKDVTFAVASDTSSSAVLDEIARNIVDLDNMQNSVITIDIFQKEEDTKHLTYRIELRHKDHTLTSEEANSIVSDMVSQVENKIGAKVI